MVISAAPAAAFGGSGKTSGDPVVVGSSDTQLSTYGVAGGIDYRFSPYTVVGLAAAGGGTNWSLSNALGGGRSDSAQIGAYARTVIGPAYIAESIAFASHWFTTNRTALGDNLRGTFTGESLGARIEGGYRFAATPNFGITPYAAAQAQAFHSGAYTETDVNNLGFGLAYAAQNATDVRTELGARFDNPTLLGGTPFIVRARLAWAHDFVDTPSLSAAFQALPFSNFTVFGAPIPHDSVLASLGVDWYINRDW
jgi:outer membrane autotransporter protein